MTIALAAGLTLVAPVAAQDEDEGTRLERLIEGALSGAGREVTVRGFRGALTGRAEMESLTIADESGVWLSIDDAVLDWNRSALLRGRLQVAELSATRIDVDRLPVAGTGDPLAPEASGTPLQLPDLPVAVIVEELSAETLSLGAPVLGQELTATLEGRVQLDGGEGEAVFSLLRTGGTRGEIALDAAYSNETDVLSLDLLFDEGEGGVVATLAGLPDAPPLRFTAVGEGPLDEFAAEIALATDGEERFGGTVSTTADETARRIAVDLDGDLRPLVEAEYRDFFGQSAALEAVAVLRADGETEIEGFDLSTGALALSGRVVLNDDGVPRLIEVDGRISDASGEPVLLPLTGEETRVSGAELSLSFDAAEGPDWQGRFVARDVVRSGFEAEELRLDGSGRIEADPAAVSAAFDFAARSLDLGGAASQQAFGETVTGRAVLAWEADGPLEFTTLEVEGETYSASAEGTVDNASSTFDIAGSLRAEAENLAAFSGLAGRPLSGSVEAEVTGQGSVFAGLVDVEGAVTGQDLAVGDDRIDPYLDGATSTVFAVRRTTEGLFLERFELSGAGVEANAAAELSSESGALDAAFDIDDLSPLAEGLSGPGSGEIAATMSEGTWTWQATTAALSASLEAEGTVSGLGTSPLVTAAGRFEAERLAAFSQLAGRELGGSADLEFSARAEPGSGRYALDAEGTVTDAATGLAQADALLAGETDIAFTAALDGSAIDVEQAQVASDAATFEGSGAWSPGFETFRADAELAVIDVAVLAPGFSGPATLTVNVDPISEGGPWSLDAALSGPVIEAAASGELRDLGGIPAFDGTLTADIDDLSPVGEVLGRALGGAVELQAKGEVRADLSTFDIVASGSALNAGTGIEPVDRILSGTATFEVDAARDGDTIEVTRATVDTAVFEAEAEGTLGNDTAFGFSARLADIALLIDGFSGPVTAEGRASTTAGGENVEVDASLRGPAGATADVSGTVAPDGGRAALDIDGAAPLGLVNGLIAPRAVAGQARFDLALNGPIALESLSGRITASDAILSAPLLDLALDGIDASVDLQGGRAGVDLSGRLRSGGRVSVDGNIGLGSSLAADLAVALDNVVLVDPNLYQAELDGRLSIDGPLAGGARISGRVDVAEAELRIPSSPGTGGGGLPDITHVNEPPGVRATRARAGLIDTGGNGNGSDTAAAFGLDILVSAPNRIFVRGRGLDAELGGTVRLRGTTRNVAPAGRFDLIRGRLDILGRRLSLTQGSIDLTGALIPRIRLVAETEVEDATVSVIVEGPADDPEIRFESRPQLPEDEVLALLLFGRGIETLSPLQVARLAAAVATLRNPGEGLLGGVRQGAGLADLDVTATEDGGAAVRAGTYIGENVYTDVTVDTEGDAEINLNLDLSDSITVRGSTSNTGRSSLGVFFERDY